MISSARASRLERLAADRLVARFDLIEPDLVALREYRRLAALYWLIRLRPGRRASRRYSTEAIEGQAQRLLTLLG